MSRDDAPPMILAYGSWANVAGRPGAACNRGAPPCIGKGLRAKLSNHFIVASTPEAWTSETCSRCGIVVRSLRRGGPGTPRQDGAAGEDWGGNEDSGAVFPCVGCAVVKTQKAQSTTTATTTLNIGVRLKTLFCPPVHAAADGGLPLGVDEIDATLSALDAELF